MLVLLTARGTFFTSCPSRKGTDRCGRLSRPPSRALALRPARARSDIANLSAGAAGGARFRAPRRGKCSGLLPAPPPPPPPPQAPPAGGAGGSAPRSPPPRRGAPAPRHVVKYRGAGCA